MRMRTCKCPTNSRKFRTGAHKLRQSRGLWPGAEIWNHEGRGRPWGPVWCTLTTSSPALLVLCPWCPSVLPIITFSSSSTQGLCSHFAICISFKCAAPHNPLPQAASPDSARSLCCIALNLCSVFSCIALKKICNSFWSFYFNVISFPTDYKLLESRTVHHASLYP